MYVEFLVVLESDENYIKNAIIIPMGQEKLQRHLKLFIAV